MREKYNLIGLFKLVLAAHQSGVPTVKNSNQATNSTDVSNLPLRKEQTTQVWGFTPRAEALNGRLAMLGFGISLSVELFSGQGFLHFLHLL